MKNIWECWTEGLSASECDSIVERGLAYTPQDATIGFEQTSRTDTGFRSSVIRWLDHVADEDIVARIMQFVHSSNRTNFGFDLQAPFDLQFTEYHGTDSGKYDWHHDVWLDSPRPFARKLSVVVQLSDPSEYDGGTFEFFDVPHPGEMFAPRGSVLLFPSFLQHRVLPVTRGLRRSLVTWVEGPKWR